MMPVFYPGPQWKIFNKDKQSVLAQKAEVADSFLSRLCGLIPRKELRSEEGLIITRCNSIHMLFMRFAIDAVFVDKNHIVVGVVKNIHPYRFSRMFWSASYCIEVPPGTIDATRTEPQDCLEFFVQKSS